MGDKRKRRTCLIYIGRRISSNGKKLLDAFVRSNDLDTPMCYAAQRVCRWTIGDSYLGLIDKDNSLTLGSLEFKESGSDDPELKERIIEWAIQDVAARRAKQNESARSKVQKERRESWMEALEPLRREYRQMSSPQRRAMRQLIIEWLDGV